MTEKLDEKVQNMNLEEKAPGKKREFKGKGDKKKKAEVSDHALEVSKICQPVERRVSTPQLWDFDSAFKLIKWLFPLQAMEEYVFYKLVKRRMYTIVAIQQNNT